MTEFPDPLSNPFAVPGQKPSEYTDGRRPGEWESKYPQSARRAINFEAAILFVLLIFFCVTSGLLLCLSNQHLTFELNWLKHSSSASPDRLEPSLTIEFRLLMIFFVGSLGGTTFSMKWLVHSVAKCKWHLDRRYWRLFVPLIGGVYACVVLTLFDGGTMIAQEAGQSHPTATTAALAFLVGYFSDGVSGLLSNVANAVFGTLEKK
jgi:hypothetical protein